MLRLRSSRLARVAGAAAFVIVLGGRAFAQDAAPDPDLLRAGIDATSPENAEQELRPAARDSPEPDARTVLPPSSGAGPTGFISSNVGRATPVKNSAGQGLGPPGGVRLRGGEPQGRAAGGKNGGAAPLGKSPSNKAAATPVAKVVRNPAATQSTADAVIRIVGFRRKGGLEEDPFAAPGIRVGAFVLRPALELISGYDTNPARDSNGRGSAVLVLAPELKLNSDWERHELTANIRGSYSDFPSVPLVDRPFLDSKVAGRIDVDRNTLVVLEGRFLLSTENPGSPNLQAGLAKLPIYTDVGATAGGSRQLNRLVLSLRGLIDRVAYEDSLLTDGTFASNKDRAYDQYGVQARAGYELTPGVRPFVEIDSDWRVHDLPVDFSGYSRDSAGVTPKIGTSFEITHKLTGEVSVGYLERTYKDPRLPDLHGLIVDSALVWTATGLTTVKLTAVSAADESVLPGVSGLFRRDIGVEFDHALRRWLIATVKLGWGLDDYVGLNREDKRYGASLGLIYNLSRDLQLKGEVRELWLRSNASGVDYTATVLLAGLRLQH